MSMGMCTVRRNVLVATIVTVFFLAICALYPHAAIAATYYVATTGNDSDPGTLDQPFLTIFKGLTVLVAGDTLFIRGGTYTTSTNWSANVHVPSGTSWSNAITIAAYPSEVATIDRIAIQDNIDLSIVSYLIFDHITTPSVWFGGGAHHIRLINSDVNGTIPPYLPPDTPNYGVMLIQGNVNFFEVLNSKIHDAGYNGTTTPCFSTTVNYGCYGFYVGGHDMIFERNEIYNNSGYGINLYDTGQSGVSNNIIRNNVFYANGFHDYGRDFPLAAFIVSSGSDNLAYNNIVYNNCIGIQAFDTNGGTNNQIYNNTVYNNGTVAEGTCTIPGPGILVNESAFVITNNIVYGNGSAIDDYTTGATYSNNLCASATPHCDVVGDPQFVNAAGNNFHLQASSAARNAGTTVSSVPTDYDGITRPQETAYDIGAYEYQVSPSQLRVPSNLTIIIP